MPREQGAYQILRGSWAALPPPVSKLAISPASGPSEKEHPQASWAASSELLQVGPCTAG